VSRPPLESEDEPPSYGDDKLEELELLIDEVLHGWLLHWVELHDVPGAVFAMQPVEHVVQARHVAGHDRLPVCAFSVNGATTGIATIMAASNVRRLIGRCIGLLCVKSCSLTNPSGVPDNNPLALHLAIPMPRFPQPVGGEPRHEKPTNPYMSTAYNDSTQVRRGSTLGWMPHFADRVPPPVAPSQQNQNFTFGASLASAEVTSKYGRGFPRPNILAVRLVGNFRAVVFSCSTAAL
jgi:hypothetical protein